MIQHIILSSTTIDDVSRSTDDLLRTYSLKALQAMDGNGYIPGKVERGFMQCYTSVYAQVFEWASQLAHSHPDWDIIIAGHSLGGATAHIAATGWASTYPDYLDRTWVFTYGAPRAGDLEFQERLYELYGSRMHNFRHAHDLVAHVPLLHVPGIHYANPGSLLTFRPQHQGAASWFDGDNWEWTGPPNEEKHVREGLVSMAKDIRASFAQHTTYCQLTPPLGRHDRPLMLPI
jgi:hypothetical protein